MVRKYGRTISIVEIAFCLSWKHSAPFSPFFFHDHAIAGSEILLCIIKFIYSEKATNFCEISNVSLSYAVTVKSKVEILKFFLAFSEFMNFYYLAWVTQKGEMCDNGWGPLRKMTNKCISLKSIQRNCLWLQCCLYY